MPFPLPEYIQLYPSFRCNQHCRFCSNEGTVTGDLTYEKAKWLLEILSFHGTKEIDIVGGEPMLLDWMPDFVMHATEQGFEINLSTNGSRPELLDRFQGADRRLLKIGVSLEGSSAERHNQLTGSNHFDKAVESIKILSALGLDPVVKTVVHVNMVQDISSITAILRAMGISRYCLIHMDLLSANADMRNEALGYGRFIRLFQETKRSNPDITVLKVHASCFSKKTLPAASRCAAGVLKLSVLPDGTVFPCSLLNGNKDYLLGNIFFDSLDSIWMNPKLDYFRRFTHNHCGIPDCSHKDCCTGGCPAHGIYHTGNPDAADIRCSLAQKGSL